MDLREKITVNDVEIRLKPYTERRHKELMKVEKEVDDFIEKHKKKKFRDIPRKDKAEIWMKKARIMWDPAPLRDSETGELSSLNADFWDDKEQFFTLEFFKDQDFEYPLLQKSEVFFLSQELYL